MKKISYDKKAVGKRLQEKRKHRGWDRKYVAGKVGLVEKYYADIERGTCGMSVETLIALTELYEITMDSLIYGSTSVMEVLVQDRALLRELENMSPRLQDTCRQLLVLFVNGVREGEEEKAMHGEEEEKIIHGGEMKTASESVLEQPKDFSAALFGRHAESAAV